MSPRHPADRPPPSPPSIPASSTAAETTAVTTGPDGAPLEVLEEPPPPAMVLEEGVETDGPSDEAQEGALPPAERLG